jgi:hypothetical protein
MRSLYRNASTSSTAIFMATNSEPNVEASTVFCLLENQMTGARLMKMIIPVCDLLVTLQPAWSASTKHEVTTLLPRGSGALGGT